MAKFAVSVGGANYEVEAPDERTAWKWANATHLQAIKNDPREAPIPKGLETATSTIGSELLPMVNTGNGVDISKVPYEVGAKVNDALVQRNWPPEQAAALGTAANLGMEGFGMLAGGAIGTGAGAIAKPAMQDTGRWLMQKALKPSTRDHLLGKGGRAIDTLLEEGVNVSPRGVEKLRRMGEKLNQKAGAEIAGSTARVGMDDVAQHLGPTRQRFMSQVDPHADLAAIDAVKSNFYKHPQLTGSTDMPVQLANQLKTGTQARLKAKYGQIGNAEEEAQKALAYGLRQEIERGVPTVGPINKKASDIWNALNVTERRAYVGGNNNPVSLPTAFSMVHNPAFGAGMIVNTSDKAKSLLARMLYTGGKAAPYLGGGAGMASVLMDNE